MKSILVLIHDDTGQEARLLAAIDLTRTLNGHLISRSAAMLAAFRQKLHLAYCPDLPSHLSADDCHQFTCDTQLAK